jgi:FMN reductase
MASVVVFSGSPSLASKTAILGDFVATSLKERGFWVTHVKVRELPGEALLAGDADHPVIARETRRIADADGAVFVTPIYKASFSGLTKLFIDLLPQFALRGKVVMPLATGGSLAHVLALDYGLRPVLQSLGARHIVQSFFVLQSEIESEVSKAISVAPLFRQALDEFCESATFDRSFLAKSGAAAC